MGKGLKRIAIGMPAAAIMIAADGVAMSGTKTKGGSSKTKVEVTHNIASTSAVDDWNTVNSRKAPPPPKFSRPPNTKRR